MRLRGTPQLVRFTFDGKALHGVPGEPVAAALLANGIRLVARSFKYHRPRGIFSAGPEEPNALVTIGRAPALLPNQRATMVPVSEGLVVHSQNAWPSLRHDLLGLNDLAAPLLGAGFYYKTFMWPRKAWLKYYEPLIRKAAGLGALSGQADGDVYEKAYAFCDLLVIGGGPAGLMAALVAAQAGADVILADEDSALGGRALREREMIADQPADRWAAGVAAQLAALPNVRIMTRTAVTGVYDHGTYGALQDFATVGAAGAPRACFWRIVARRAVLAAGAVERPIAFAGNDRPGVMLAGAVRSYVNRWGVTPGQRVVVFGNNDDAHRSADDLVAAGVQVVALLDSRAGVTGTGDYPCYSGATVLGTAGRLGLRSVRIAHQGGDLTLGCDCLAVSGGWNPNVHLSCHLGARPVWRDDIAAFVPRAGAVPDLVPNLVAAGAACGTFDTAGCLREGAEVAAAQLRDLGFTPKPTWPSAAPQKVAITPLWQVAGKGRKWVDLQNDVTVDDIAQSAQENFRAVEHMKRYTTQGMAPDQGKSSNVLALAILGELTGQTPAQTGTTTFRAPYVPVPIAAMGAGGQGAGFAPARRSAADHAAQSARAPMIAAGLWYRPSYFPIAGEAGWRQACAREVGYVRGSVGVCDVSTLGKIDVQGPDAAAFLDFVYANAISSLAQARARYGLMLREDGHVMDDGTITRLGAAHYLLSTTTAAATQVWRHLQFVAQVLRPDWDVMLNDVTDHWAQFAISGPRAQVLLASMLDDGAVDLPFMGHRALALGGVDARVSRISFTGEIGFEIAVPARYGESLFRQLLAQARTLGGGPYGLEALNVLRIEKGYLTHAEMHGRVAAADLGLGALVDLRKDCIGQAAARRPGLLAADRAQLVGLRGMEQGRRLTAGAHLFAQNARAVRVNDQGYITSACYSPTLGAYLALGFLQNGRARHGEVIRMVDHLRGVDTLAQVCAPQFFDPSGGRARG